MVMDVNWTYCGDRFADTQIPNDYVIRLKRI